MFGTVILFSKTLLNYVLTVNSHYWFSFRAGATRHIPLARMDMDIYIYIYIYNIYIYIYICVCMCMGCVCA